MSTPVSRCTVSKCQAEDGVSQPAFETRVVAVLLEQLSVILEQADHHSQQSGIVFDPCFALVALLHGVLIRFVGGDFGWNLFRDQLVDPILVVPRNVPELVVEGFEDVRQPIEFRLGLPCLLATPMIRPFFPSNNIPAPAPSMK